MIAECAMMLSVIAPRREVCVAVDSTRVLNMVSSAIGVADGGTAYAWVMNRS
jgi:hypothetical protein